MTDPFGNEHGPRPDRRDQYSTVTWMSDKWNVAHVSHEVDRALVERMFHYASKMYQPAGLKKAAT